MATPTDDDIVLTAHLRLVNVETARIEVQTNAPREVAKRVNPWNVREALWHHLRDMGPVPLCLDKPVPASEASLGDVNVACVLSAIMPWDAVDALEQRWRQGMPAWVEEGVPLRTVLVRQRIAPISAVLEEDEKRPADIRARVPFDTLALRGLPVRYFSTPGSSGPASDVDDAVVRQIFGRYGDVRQTLVCVNAKHPSNFDLYVQFASREQMAAAYAAFARRALMFSPTPFTDDSARAALQSPRKSLAFYRLDVDRCGVFLAEPLCAQQPEGACLHTPVRRCRSIQGAAIQQQELQQQQLQLQVDGTSPPSESAASAPTSLRRLCLMDRRALPSDVYRVGAEAPLPPFDASAVPPPKQQEASKKRSQSPPQSPTTSGSPPGSPPSTSDSVSDITATSAPNSPPSTSSTDTAERPRKRRRGRVAASLGTTSTPVIAPASAGLMTPRRTPPPQPQQMLPSLAEATAAAAAPHAFPELSETDRLRATSKRRASLASLLSHTDEASIKNDAKVQEQILRSSSAELITLDSLLTMRRPSEPLLPPPPQYTQRAYIAAPTQHHQAYQYAPPHPQQQAFFVRNYMTVPMHALQQVVAAQQAQQAQLPINPEERNKQWLDDRWAAFQGRSRQSPHVQPC